MINAIVLCLCQTVAPATAQLSAKPGSVVEAVPDPDLHGSWLSRFLWGDNWRDLWTTPIRARVANLEKDRGGLTAYERPSTSQSLSLRFRDPEGRHFQFRSVPKVPGQQAHFLVRGGPGAWVLRHRVSGIFPGAALYVGELEKKAGLVPTERWLAVLPESPRLGEWNEDFAGVLGIFERRYDPDETRFPELPGAIEVISTRDLFERLEGDSVTRVDQDRFLSARLFDMLVGDFDRLSQQWGWVGYDREGFRWWVALPRDRDWALAHLGGVGNWFAGFFRPSRAFKARYGNISGLVIRSKPLDRRLLTGLDREDFRQAAIALQRRLDHTAIEAAARALPAEFSRTRIAGVVHILKQRRDSLTAAADQFYERLVRIVDVRGTAGSERVRIARSEDGHVTIEMATPSRRSQPWFSRRFLPGETTEVRLYLLGGADTVRIEGQPGAKPITLRLVTGGPDDVVRDATGGAGIHQYAESTFTPPVEPKDPTQIYRDFGSSWGLSGSLNARAELGVMLGAGPIYTKYRFRRVPYEYRLGFRLGTTTGEGGVNIDLRGDYRFMRPHSGVVFRGTLYNRDMMHYWGLGNETVAFEDRSFHYVVQREYTLEPVLEVGLNRSGTARMQVGGVVQWTEPLSGRPTLLAAELPYGSGSFTEAGATAGFLYDTRDDPRFPTKGLVLSLTGRGFPAIFDVGSAFGSVAVEGKTFLTPRGLPTTLALRLGAMQTAGTWPYFEGATLGGRQSFRGVSRRRFVGDAAAYGNAELRLNLGELGGFGGDWGVYGLADVGRVWLDQEDSDRWHSALGGGLWISALHRQHVLTATVAKSGDDKLRFILYTRFHY
ncbi:MAG: BamA/TamA family outer membrane protein [Gemmatimonadales bacterium]